MTKYTLIEPTNPILTTPCQPFVFDGTIDPEELASDLIETMHEKNGIGLAANQVGLPYRVFVVRGDPFACYNPRIVDVSEEEVLLEEGCLTYPGLYVKVKRPKSIRVRFQNIRGDTETHKFTGMTARIIQHEIGHLDGEVFYTLASKFHKDQAFRKQKEFLRHPERFSVKTWS